MQQRLAICNGDKRVGHVQIRLAIYDWGRCSDWSSNFLMETQVKKVFRLVWRLRGNKRLSGD